MPRETEKCPWAFFFLFSLCCFLAEAETVHLRPILIVAKPAREHQGIFFCFFYKSFVMKTALIVLAILAGVFLIFQIYLSMATNQTETQPYEVVRTEEGFEIRHYPAATLAVITSAATSYKSLHR